MVQRRFEELTAKLSERKKKVLQLGYQAIRAECLVFGAGKFLLGIYRKIKIVLETSYRTFKTYCGCRAHLI